MRERKGRIRRLREARILNQQLFSRKEKSTKWWSDPTKLIPIIISGVALTISCLSWWESHQGRLINQEINRPILEVTSVKIYDSGLLPDKESTHNAFIVITVKNSGRITAYTDTLEFRPQFAEGVPAECEIKRTAPGAGVTHVIILPGQERALFEVINITSECQQIKSSQSAMEITIGYSDNGSGIQRSQYFVERFSILWEGQTDNDNETLPPPTPSISPSPSK